MTGAETQSRDGQASPEIGMRIERQTSEFLAVVRGPDHIFEFVNGAYIRLIGGRPCLGRSFQEVLPEALDDGILARLDAVYRTGVPDRARNYTSRLAGSRQGEVRTLLVTFQFRPLRDRDGTISGVYIAGVDSAEDAGGEAALEVLQLEAHRQWAELESIYDSAPVGLALLGAERFEYRRLNEQQAEILGLLPEEVRGKTVREISPDIADAAEALFREVVSGKRVRDVELEGELPQRPGVKRSWLVSYSPIRLTDGTVDAIICTALETTELRRAERAAVQNEKLAAVGRLAGSIAHEINNPLEAITNLLYLARRSPTLEEAQGFLDAAEGELRRVAAITTQTLRFHRQSTDPRSISCDELLESSLSIYKSRLEGLGIQVLRRREANRSILCFDGEIRQVINNLIGNAIDAMSPGGGKLVLRSHEGSDLRTGRKGLWLTVADTGAGMSAEAQRRAFEPFYTTKGIAGTGLGLWISHEIVTRHRGRMLLRSSRKAGRSGSVFTIFLPFETARRNL